MVQARFWGFNLYGYQIFTMKKKTIDCLDSRLRRDIPKNLWAHSFLEHLQQEFESSCKQAWSLVFWRSAREHSNTHAWVHQMQSEIQYKTSLKVKTHKHHENCFIKSDQYSVVSEVVLWVMIVFAKISRLQIQSS